MSASSPSLPDRWIFQSFPVSKEQLGLYRIAFCCYQLFIIGLPRLHWIDRFPDAFYHPPWPSPAALLFSGFPSWKLLVFLDLALPVLLFLLLIGWRTRWVGPLLCLVAILSQNFAYSFGKINHDILTWVTPLIMTFTNWGAAFSVDARKGRGSSCEARGWPITLMAVIIGFCFFTAGWAKLQGGWLDLETQAVRGKLFTNYFINGRQDLLAGFFYRLDAAWFWELLDWVTVIWETGMLVAVLHPRLFRAACAFCVVFHFMTLLMMNIHFVGLFILYALFVLPLVPVDPCRAFLERIQVRWVLLLGLVYCSFHYGMQRDLALVDLDYVFVHQHPASLLLCVVATGITGYLIFSFFRPKRVGSQASA